MKAPTARTLRGSTSISATATEAATVVCPLGRLLPTAARSGSRPKSGRLSPCLSSWVVTFAPAISRVAVMARAIRPRISAMNPIIAVAASSETTDIALRIRLTGPSMVSCPIRLPVSATVSTH